MIETAVQCRERGIVTIGIVVRADARVYRRPSFRQETADVVDVALDNCAPFGDAAVVKDNEKMCP